MGSLILFLVPFILIIGLIVGIFGRFGSIQETQRDFLQALFDPSIPIAGFLDGTTEGRQIYNFIVFARVELAQVESSALLFLRENDIENVETGTDLSREERRESQKIMSETAVLRMKVVYYSMFLHEFSPLPIHANEDEILDYMGVNSEIVLGDTSENDEENEIVNSSLRPWIGFRAVDYTEFVRAFFEMDYVYDFDDFYNEYATTSTPIGGRLLWERIENGDISPFFNSTIYSQISRNVGRSVNSQHEALVETIWQALTSRMFLDFTGRFATPVEPQFMNNITSPFGYRSDPFTGRTVFHSGVDIAWANCFGEPIFAVYDGIIRQAHDTGNGFGIMVIVEHPSGWQTWYAHASEAFVRVGEAVEAGQRIASIGSTGRSTGAHLHFELRIGGRPADPMQFWN